MRFAYVGLGVSLLACGLGCRRPPIAGANPNDAGGLPSIDAADLPPFDGGAEVSPDADTRHDAADTMDVADAPGPVDATDAATSSLLPCGALRALAARGPFTPRHTRQVLFSPDRRQLVLRLTGVPNDSGLTPPDDLVRVVLPGGVLEALANGVRDAEWLGDTGLVLATLSPDGDVAVVSTDGAPTQTIARRTCAHLAAPDGSRVLVLRDCTGTAGALDEIDVATGAVTTRAPLVSGRDGAGWAFSPTGRLAAYVAIDPSVGGDPGTGVLHVIGGDGDQALVQAPAYKPVFVSDQRLLFLDGSQPYGPTSAYVHVPGSSNASQRIAQNRHFGFDRYRISRDGSLVLAALWSTTAPRDDDSLYAIRLDGGGEQLLTGRLYAYHLNQVGLTPFAFTADDQRAIYVGSMADNSGIHAVATDGSADVELADGYSFVVSPFADRVAALEPDVNWERITVRVVATTAARDPIAFTTTGGTSVRAPTFLPGDRGLLYVEAPMSTTSAGPGPFALNHLSFGDGRKSQLGRWGRSQLPVAGYPVGDMSPGYPSFDPTGCFVIVDSDLPESLGTSLVVLPDAPD